MESHSNSANSKCSACAVHRMEMQKTEWTEPRIQNKCSHNNFEGIFRGFRFANAIYVFNVIFTRQAKQQTSTKTTIQQEFHWIHMETHSHCYLEHENSRAIEIPLMKNKKKNNFNWLFRCSLSRFSFAECRHKNNAKITAPIFHHCFGPCEWERVWILRYIKFWAKSIFCSVFDRVFLHLLQFIFNDCLCHFHMQNSVHGKHQNQLPHTFAIAIHCQMANTSWWHVAAANFLRLLLIKFNI